MMLQIGVMRALAAFVTALYQSFPTTIQQDRAELATLALLSSRHLSSRSTVERQLREQRQLVVQFRLNMKTALEAALRALLKRGKDLQALQAVL
jgi:hypothetical protein